MYSFYFYTCFAKSLLDVEQRSHHSDTLKDEKVVSERQTLYMLFMYDVNDVKTVNDFGNIFFQTYCLYMI